MVGIKKVEKRIPIKKKARRFCVKSVTSCVRQKVRMMTTLMERNIKKGTKIPELIAVKYVTSTV